MHAIKLNFFFKKVPLGRKKTLDIIQNNIAQRLQKVGNRRITIPVITQDGKWKHWLLEKYLSITGG